MQFGKGGIFRAALSLFKDVTDGGVRTWGLLSCFRESLAALCIFSEITVISGANQSREALQLLTATWVFHRIEVVMCRNSINAPYDVMHF